MVKNFLINLVALVVLGGLTYQFRGTLFEEPCDRPIPYTLGTFDTQFNVSKDYFLKAILDAEAAWEGAYGKDLFIYEPEESGEILQINLVYDYRQAATKNLKNLGVEVKETKASYDAIKAKIENLKKEFEAAKKAFEARLAKWNSGPQTDRNEFEKLQSMQRELNRKIDEINSLVVTINRLAQTLNLTVEKYNTITVSRGESFEEGVYYSEEGKEGIDIYEFESRAKLVRVLAHELGHALAMNHVPDPKALMYELNQGSALTPTEADLTELKRVCES